MKVMIGWSQEVDSNHWEKIDVELDENDLRSVLAELIPELPSDEAIKPGWKFLLLKTEAERLIAVHQYQRNVLTQGDFETHQTQLSAGLKELAKKIRKTYLGVENVTTPAKP